MKRKRDQEESDTTLLTYMAATNPVPLQVSTAQTPVTGIVNTAAMNQGGSAVYCNQVLVAVPVGPDANELFAASPTPSASCNTGKWSITSMEVKSGRDLGLDDDDTQYATFTFECRDASDYEITYNLVFGVQGQMSLLTGDSTIQIQENSGTTSNPSTFTTKQTSYTVTAYTPQFYLQNFVTAAPAAPTVPSTQFANGADIQFEWESNGTFFEIYKKNVTTPIYSGTQTNYKLTGGVATDTTFFLVAMMSGNPSGDQGSAGYAPIYLYEALTVTISNPDLTPRSAAITANASVGGTFGVTGQTTLGNANVGGTLGVTGQTTLGNANVGGTLGVTGQTNVGNTSVGGTLGVTGNSTLSAAQVNSTLGVKGLATLSGGLLGTASFVSLLTGAQSISPGSYTAKTDGIVIGIVTAPGSGAGNLSVGWISGSNSDGVAAYATGGNMGCFNSSWTKYQASNNQSFALPVRKGSTWGIGASQSSSNQANANTHFWWIPLGTASSGSTFERVSDEQPETNAGLVHRKPLSYERKIKTLVGVIEDILDRQISRENQERLVSALMDLQVEDYVNEFFPPQ